MRALCSGKGIKGNVVNWTSPSDAFRVVAGPKALLVSPDRRVEPGYSGGTMFERWEEKVGRMREEKKGRGVGDGEDVVAHVPSWKGKEKAKGDSVYPESGDADEPLSPAMKRWLSRRNEVLSKSVPMSIQFANNKSKMGGKVFYASTVKKRVRAAISLIVNQGAKVVEVPEEAALELGEGEGVGIKKEVVFDLEEVERMKHEGWVMKGEPLLG